MSLFVQIERFEGPLALLLYLIRREEMDIFDINIHQITKQYLEYIKAMKKLDLELAGEFISMAATLIHIKSRMLLPNYNENGDEVEPEDPRKALVQKLLEYQKFQEVSVQLYERPLVGRDTWLRGGRLNLDPPKEELLVENNPLFSLISSYRTALKNIKKGVHKVMAELQSISERVSEIKHRLLVGIRVRVNDLLEPRSHFGDGAVAVEGYTNHVLVTFLSMLELAKVGFVSLFQAENFSDIYVEAKKEINDNVIVRSESYEYNENQTHIEFELEEGLLEEGPPDGSQKDSQAEQGTLRLANDESVIEEDTVKKDAVKKDTVEGDTVEEDKPIVIEAATDEEIAEEEERLFGSTPEEEIND